MLIVVRVHVRQVYAPVYRKLLDRPGHRVGFGHDNAARSRIPVYHVSLAIRQGHFGRSHGNVIPTGTVEDAE